MSTSLTYTTIEPIAAEIRQHIAEQASKLNHDWWAESMQFFADPENKDRLYGDTKLFLIGYSTSDGDYREIDSDDDTLMAWRDASFIVAQLEKWSASHGINWRLYCEGEVMGIIEQGTLDDAGKEFLALLLGVDDVSHQELGSRAAQISQQYADRADHHSGSAQ